MKKFLLSAAVALACIGAHAQAPTLELKGLRPGMTKAEVEALYPNGFADFSVAAVSVVPTLKYVADKLQSVDFSIPTKEYISIKDVVGTKYELTCERSMIKIDGRSVLNEVCLAQQSEVVLHLAKEMGVRGTGWMGIFALSDKQMEQAVKRKSDI